MKVLSIFFLTLLIASCTEQITEVDYNFSWEFYNEYYFDSPTNTILSAYSSNLSELIITNQYDFFKMTESYYPLLLGRHIFSPYQLNSKPVIDDIFIYYLSPDYKKISFQSHSDPYSYEIFYNNEYHDYLEVASIDSSFSEDSGIVICGGRSNSFCASNNEGEIVTIAGDFGDLNTKICRICFHVENDVCIIDSIQTTPILLWFYGFFGMNFFNGYYYLRDFDGNVLINPDNSVEGIPFSPFGLFNYDDKFWSFSTNPGEDYQLSYTEDGINWTSYMSFNNSFKVAEIDNRLIGFNGYNIYEIDLENEEIFYLDNTGLVNNEIVSINLYNEKIYVSTYNGLYYRDYSDFFVGKSSNPLATNDMELFIVGEE